MTRRSGLCRGGFSRWPVRLVVLVVVVLGLAWVVVPDGGAQRVGGARAAAGVRGAAALRRLQSLPVQAQSTISATLGSHARVFAATRSGTGYRLVGGGVRLRLSARGVGLEAGGVSFSMAFLGVGRGGRLSRPGLVSVTAHANRVVLDRGGVREWYAAGPLGVEQGFALRRRPAGGAGRLNLALGVAGAVRVQQAGSGVRFLTGSGGVAARYGDLSAIDATGRRLPVALQSRGGRLLIGVADQGARYPLRIDPFFQQGPKFTPIDEVGQGYFGEAVAVSADGHTLLIGGFQDNQG